jgi:hypothetical protein
MGTDSGESGERVDWDAFALDLTAYTAESHVRTLVEGGARVAESLGVPFSPASFILGALFRELGEVDSPDFQERVEAVKRLALHAGTVTF